MKDLINLNMKEYVFNTVIRIAQEFLLVACFFQCLNKTSGMKI